MKAHHSFAFLIHSLTCVRRPAAQIICLCSVCGNRDECAEIRDSRNGLGWKGPLMAISPTPCSTGTPTAPAGAQSQLLTKPPPASSRDEEQLGGLAADGDAQSPVLPTAPPEPHTNSGWPVLSICKVLEVSPLPLSLLPQYGTSSPSS